MWFTFCCLFTLGTGQDLDGASVIEKITANRKERCVLIDLVLIVPLNLTSISTCTVGNMHNRCDVRTAFHPPLIILNFCELVHCLRKLVWSQPIYRLASVLVECNDAFVVS